jgi:hypothetical protein
MLGQVVGLEFKEGKPRKTASTSSVLPATRLPPLDLATLLHVVPATVLPVSVGASLSVLFLCL